MDTKQEENKKVTDAILAWVKKKMAEMNTRLPGPLARQRPLTKRSKHQASKKGAEHYAGAVVIKRFNPWGPMTNNQRVIFGRAHRMGISITRYLELYPKSKKGNL